MPGKAGGAPDIESDASAKADDVWEDAGARHRRPPLIKYTDVPMTNGYTASGKKVVFATPWCLQVPQHLQQSCGASRASCARVGDCYAVARDDIFR